jgi:hypothetical protein
LLRAMEEKLFLPQESRSDQPQEEVALSL